MNKRNRALIGNFPPYGVIDKEHSDEINLGAPKQWNAGLVGTDWFAFREETLTMIADVLWPRYNRAEQRWEGDATEFMEELTEADLRILMDLRVPHDSLDALPDSPLYPQAQNCPDQRGLFRVEDLPGVFFHKFSCYDATLPPESCNLQKTFKFGVDNKCNPASTQFKQELQRPRAYQTAFLFGFDFNLEHATTSLTPSMCSGHCLQGMIGGGAIMEQLLSTGANVSPASWNALRQYTVDIGDRRVLAGVHYPADNLCSWIIALRMANAVLDPRVKPILSDAIFKNSMVYKRILASNNPVYAPALELLEWSARPSVSGTGSSLPETASLLHSI